LTTYFDAGSIILGLLEYLPQCRCRSAATRQALPPTIWIGDAPRLCDQCEPKEGWVLTDLPEAPLVRAAEEYVRAQVTKT
jgi:hypothetical protein